MSEQKISLPKDFVKRVQEAIHRIKMEGIELWRPNIPKGLEDFFDVVIVQESMGCDNEQCNHNTHDPASPTIKLIPKAGTLIYLGEVKYGEDDYIYYALITSSGTKYFEIVQKPFYWTEIFEVGANVVPDFLFARLGESK
jgi:hypothetical protein